MGAARRRRRVWICERIRQVVNTWAAPTPPLEPWLSLKHGREMGGVQQTAESFCMEQKHRCISEGESLTAGSDKATFTRINLDRTEEVLVHLGLIEIQRYDIIPSWFFLYAWSNLCMQIIESSQLYLLILQYLYRHIEIEITWLSYTVKSYIIKCATMLAMLIYNHTKKGLLAFWLLT